MPFPPEPCQDIEPNRVAGCEEGQRKGSVSVAARQQTTVATCDGAALSGPAPRDGTVLGLAGFWPPRHPADDG